MRNSTRAAFNAWKETLAQINGVPAVSEKFTVAPSVEQTIETRIQESSDFLGRINIVGVTEQMGEKLGLGVGGTVASTTDTSTTDRATQDITTLDAIGYVCTQTNFDTHLTYAKLDMWAKFQDFQTRIRDAVLKRQALDRITIGFNGTSRAATSNRATNPLLQDVNKGWIKKARENAPERILSEVVATSAKVNVGATGDYKNLDALVFDAVNNMLQPWYAEDSEMVVIMGRELLADHYFPLISNYPQPTEAKALDMLISAKRVGGLQAVRVPSMPANSLMITRLDNLSIYYQEGTRRRAILDTPKRDRVETFESVNEAYVVEDHGGLFVVENITFV